MMIEVGGKQFRTLDDEFFVNGKKVIEAYANGILVYPEKGTWAVKLRGQGDGYTGVISIVANGMIATADTASIGTGSKWLTTVFGDMKIVNGLLVYDDSLPRDHSENGCNAWLHYEIGVKKDGSEPEILSRHESLMPYHRVTQGNIGIQDRQTNSMRLLLRESNYLYVYDGRHMAASMIEVRRWGQDQEGTQDWLHEAFIPLSEVLYSNFTVDEDSEYEWRDYPVRVPSGQQRPPTPVFHATRTTGEPTEQIHITSSDFA